MTGKPPEPERFEGLLAEALGVDVPDGLARRIIERQRRARHAPRNWWRWRGSPRYALAFAASALILVGALGVRLWDAPDAHGLDMEAFVLLDLERHRMGAARHVPDAEIDGMLQAVGARRIGDLGVVDECKVAVVNGRKTALMRLPGEKGPVGLALIAGQTVAVRDTVEGANFRGLVIPAERGSIAIVGEPDEALEEVERTVLGAVRWL